MFGLLRDGKKCVIYVRVSTVMQVDGFSLDGQKRVLQNYAEREGMTVVATYEDAGKSGKSIEGRPAFQKMLLDIQGGLDIDYILVYKLSRFGRNAADILTSLELIQSFGVNLICADDGIDSSQTSGRLLISVLSAVAQIERENIAEQTMNGRREKAKQGGWNGGFAPYGYKLEAVDGQDKKQLVIADDEAEAIRIIFDKFVNTDMGLNGVAKHLNQQGISKKVRHNGKLDAWSSHLVKRILDNPVYMGMIAYGRRQTEKVKGSKDTKLVKADDYILEQGQHEAIVTPELWEMARAKRTLTGVKNQSAIGRDRVHLLSGILRCPECGQAMYTNRNSWTSKKTGYHETYYYVCSHKRGDRGSGCTYNRQLREDVVEGEVIGAIRELVDNPVFADEIKKRIGREIDTSAIDLEIANYQKTLKEVESSKRRLEHSIDTLPDSTKYRERKLADMNRRLDGLYETMYDLESKIEEAQTRKRAIELQALTADNVYRVLANFDSTFDRLTDDEKRTVISTLIKEIQVFKRDNNDGLPQNLRQITFNFPVFVDGQEVNQLLWENESTVETVVSLRRENIDDYIDIRLDTSLLENAAGAHATYGEIKGYVQEQFGLNVSTLYIAQIKEKCGLKERANYNHARSEDGKVPQCPPEKEKAIMAAFRHFGMLA